MLPNWLLVSGLSAVAAALGACERIGSGGPSHQLSSQSDQTSIGNLTGGVSSGLYIGATARRVAVLARPSPTAATIGLLTAGAKLSRSEAPVGDEGCAGGWYAIAPRGYVCLNEQTTLDERHPTLLARELKANTEAALPYPYAIARNHLPLFEPDPEHRDGVKEHGRLKKGSIFAVVGAWDTLDDYDQRQRLAMLTLGSFVPTRGIEPIRQESFMSRGFDATTQRLPIGLARTAKIRWYRFVSSGPSEGGFLTNQQPIALTVKARIFEEKRYLRLANDNYVAEKDVAIVRQREEFPSFVKTSTNWVDVDLDQGIAILYVGKRPQYVALLRAQTGSTGPRGLGWVKSKQITDLTGATATADPSFTTEDRPWVIELDSGMTLRAAVDPEPSAAALPPHQLALNPGDAARLFRFLAPAIPANWHSVVAADPRREGSPILVR